MFFVFSFIMVLYFLHLKFDQLGIYFEVKKEVWTPQAHCPDATNRITWFFLCWLESLPL